MAVHAGSWFGLPDFGITEMFTGNRTAQGGSNLFGNQKASTGQTGPTNGGQVNGDSTSFIGPVKPIGPVAPNNPSGGGQPLPTNNPQQQQGPAPEDQYRQQQQGLIDSQFSSYFSNLDKQAEYLPETQKSLEQQIGNMFSDQSGQVTSSRDSNLGDLDASRTKVNANQVSSLRDLESNLRNSLQAGNIYLGARGAGDSSAANQYSYALSKVGNKNRADLLKQANGLYADIDLRANKVKTTADEQINQLNTWKNNELLKVGDYVREQKQRIEEARAAGQMDRATALRELNTNVFNAAQQRLAQIDSQAMGFKNALSEWALSRSQTLGELKNNFAQLASVNIPEFQQQQINGVPTGTQPTGSSGVDLYGSLGQKKDTQSPFQFMS